VTASRMVSVNVFTVPIKRRIGPRPRTDKHGPINYFDVGCGESVPSAASIPASVIPSRFVWLLARRLSGHI
jgi:hypothetical protein